MILDLMLKGVIILLKSYIAVESVTYAIKGRELLLKNGFKDVYFQRRPNLSKNGCGYAVYVNKNINKAVDLFHRASIPIIFVERDGNG